MSISNLLGIEAVRAIYGLILAEPQYLTGLIKELPEFSKQTISKYVGQMELSGIIVGNWMQGDDNRWRRYYVSGSSEWSRLLKEIVELEEKTIKD